MLTSRWLAGSMSCLAVLGLAAYFHSVPGDQNTLEVAILTPTSISPSVPQQSTTVVPLVPSSSPQELQSFGHMLKGEVQQMRYFLGAASGGDDPCANYTGAKGCIVNTDLPSTVEGILNRCGKIGVWEIKNDPGYNPAYDEPWLTYMADACNDLQNATVQMGQPENTPAWKEKLKAIWAMLPVLPY